MAVYKSNGKYYYRGSYKLDDKIIQYKRLAKGAKTKKEALELEDIFLNKARNTGFLSKNITFKFLVNDYLTYIEKVNLLKQSSYTDNIYVYTIINNYIGHYSINNLNKYIIQNFINDLSDKYSVKYTQKIYYYVKKVLDYAVFNDFLTFNVCNNVIVPIDKNLIKESMKYWTLDEFNVFINIVKTKPLYYALYNFLYFMGCRKGEALALKWSDINLKTKKVHIYKTATFGIKGIPYKVTTPKTKNSNRIITMPDRLCNIMLSWYDFNKSDQWFNDDVYIFGFDRPLAPENLRRTFKYDIDYVNNILKSKNNDLLPYIRIHDFRHSHASYLISLKLYDYDIAKRLGDTVETLHNVYAHWFDTADNDIVNAMNLNI